MAERLSLFPLPLVLFPRASLPLKIFEPRYLRMVRDCSEAGAGFGVVRHFPAESGRAGAHAAVGTEALIEDFFTLEDGLLGIQCRGRRRFRVIDTRARDDGLLIGEVDWIAPEPAVPVPPEYAALQTILREVLQRREFSGLIDADPDDASALGLALSALLPLHPDQAQAALEITDPAYRLECLLAIIEQAPDEDSED